MLRWCFGMPAVALAVCTTRSAAQSLGPWDDPGRERTVALEVVKPASEGGFFSLEFDVPTSLIYLTTQARLSHTVTLVAQIPFEHASIENLFAGPIETSLIGNPYVGVDLGSRRAGLGGELGVRPPLSSDPGDLAQSAVAATIAQLADFDRFEAFLDDVWSARARVRYRWRSPAGATVGGGVGPTLIVGGDESVLLGGTDTALDYYLEVGYDGGRFGTGVALTGRSLLGEADGLLAGLEDPVHQLSFGLGVTIGKARPTVVMRFPLDRDLSSAVRWSLGLGVSVGL